MNTHHCPFCGSDKQGMSISGFYRIRCDECGALGPAGETHEGATCLWNAWIDNLLSVIKKMADRVDHDEARRRAPVQPSPGAAFDVNPDGTRVV